MMHCTSRFSRFLRGATTLKSSYGSRWSSTALSAQTIPVEEGCGTSGRPDSMLQPPKLSVTEMATSVVKPLEKTAHREIIDPISNDLWTGIRDVYAPNVFAFRSGNEGKVGSQLVTKIKESLQKVLVPFYPLAGRWIATEGGGRQLLCNDAGVPFVEAYTDRDLDEVFPMENFGTFLPARVSDLYSKSYEAAGLDAEKFVHKLQAGGNPGLLVQVTHFKCGGVVVAPTFNHMTFDASGFFTFMQAWSDIALTGKTPITPIFNRDLAKLKSVEDHFPPSAFNRKDRTEAEMQNFKLMPRKLFQVRKSFIEAMKEDIRVKTNGAQYVSTEDCILGNTWQALLRLPSSVTHEKQIVPLSMVEGRTRFYDPPLSKDYCGNVLGWLVFPKLVAADILERPATFAALKIREKLLSTTQTEWLSPPRLMELIQLLMNDKNSIWVNTSWFKYPAYRIDLGFSKPFLAFPGSSFPYTNSYLGRSYVCPPNPRNCQSAANLFLNSSPQVLDALSSDPKFMSMFLESNSV